MVICVCVRVCMILREKLWHTLCSRWKMLHININRNFWNDFLSHDPQITFKQDWLLTLHHSVQQWPQSPHLQENLHNCGHSCSAPRPYTTVSSRELFPHLQFHFQVLKTSEDNQNELKVSIFSLQMAKSICIVWLTILSKARQNMN